jgi:molecular chaperone GrpE
MTGKEKSETLKHNMAGKKKPAPKHTGKPVPENNKDQDNNKLLEDLKAFEDKTKELQDKYLRLSAEFDNYRKRTLKEKAEMIKTASEDLIKQIIPFVDDIERGLKAVNTSQEIDAIKQGMNLIYGRFKDFLQLNGVKEIEALNQEFNTDMHEAITKIATSDEGQKGKVMDVIEKGYLLHDKVIRYPKVIVGE